MGGEYPTKNLVSALLWSYCT